MLNTLSVEIKEQLKEILLQTYSKIGQVNQQASADRPVSPINTNPWLQRCDHETFSWNPR